MDNKKVRNSNIELLRIVAMFLIVIGHYSYYGILTHPDSFYCEGSLFNRLLVCTLSSGDVGVGCFFLITGYFAVFEKSSSLRNVCMEVLFYAFLTLLTGIGCLAWGGISYPSIELLLTFIKVAFIPLSGGVWWFATAYLLLSILTPVLNTFLKILNRRGHLLLSLLLCIFGYVLGNLNAPFHTLEIAVFFFTVGACIRKYLDCKTKGAVLAIFTIVFIIFKGALKYLYMIFYLSDGPSAELFRRSVTFVELPVTVLVSISLFLCFLSFDMNSPKINILARYMFGVYLFHENPFVREILWHYLFDTENHFLSEMFFVYILLIPFSVFGVGIIIDCFRELLFKWKLDNYVDYWMGRVIPKYTNYKD